MTRLINAIKTGDIHEVKALIEAGTDVDQPDQEGVTPLLWAVRHGHEGIVELLLKANANVDCVDHNGDTPLIWAVRNGNEDIVRKLLNAGANVSYENKQGERALSIATIKHRYQAIADLLTDRIIELANKAKKNSTPIISHAPFSTPLIDAIKKGERLKVEQLIQNGDNVDELDQDNNSPLLWAVKAGEEDIVRLLLEKKAKIDCADLAGNTPLMWAVNNENTGIVMQLLHANADIHFKNNRGETPLTLAKTKRKTIIHLLIEERIQNPDLNIYNNTVLIKFAQRGDEAIVRELLEAKADPTHTCGHDDTALAFAIKNRHENIISILLEKNLPLDHIVGAIKTAANLSPKADHLTLKALLGPHLTNPKSTIDEFTPALVKINKITECLMGDQHKKERKMIRDFLDRELEFQTNNLLFTRQTSKADVESYLVKLRRIQKQLNFIQPKKKFGQDKTIMKKINSLIERTERAARELNENTVNYKILELFQAPNLEDALTHLMPRLVQPHASDINQIRKTVVALSVDQRKKLREALKGLLDKTAAKKRKELTEEDQWILDLHKKYNTEEKNNIPFIAILRVSESGEKPDHNTTTWRHFINTMKTGQFIKPSGNIATIEKQGFLSSKQERDPVTGQLMNSKVKGPGMGNKNEDF